MWTRLYGGKTPQTPLSVFNVGFAHDGGIPLSPLQIGGDPQTPQIVWLIPTVKLIYMYDDYLSDHLVKNKN